jgi:ribosomal protein L16
MKVQRRLQKKCIYKFKIDHSSNLISSGDYVICALENGFITKHQMECCRILIRRELRRKGFLLIHSYFNLPITNKSTGTRMGKGKGVIKEHIGLVFIYSSLFELKGIPFFLAYKLLKKISYKLPFKVCLVDRQKNFFKLK